MSVATSPDQVAPPRLKRVLSLWDLIFYGIVCVTPIAPLPLFGITQKLSSGHAVTTIVLAMAAMLPTAASYGRMAAIYPTAGSAYTYVGRGLNPHLGFLAGWAMFLDYLLIPLINVIFGAVTLHRLIPSVPYAVWAALFAMAITGLNLRGIRSTARANQLLLLLMSLVLVAFAVAAVRYLLGHQDWAGLFSTQPFYNPATFNFAAIRTATSFAALTYIGFDSVTTLAEEVHDPKKNVMRAAVTVCLFTGLVGGLVVYLGQLVWPGWLDFPNLETSFMDVTRRVGGPLLFHAMGATFLLAVFGSALTGQAGAARLLFSMGRENALPRSLFARVNAEGGVPAWNITFIGIITFAGALIFGYEQAAEVLNFGAFLAFMGVNLASVKHIWQNARGASALASAALPALGFLFCLWIWISLPMPAKLIGGAWLAVGLIHAAITSRGFRRPPVALDFTEQ